MRDTVNVIRRAHMYNCYGKEVSCLEDADEENRIFDQQHIREHQNTHRVWFEMCQLPEQAKVLRITRDEALDMACEFKHSLISGDNEFIKTYLVEEIMYAAELLRDHKRRPWYKAMEKRIRRLDGSY